MKKKKQGSRMGLVGVFLMAFAAFVVGLFAGAYFSEPIMADVVNYQNGIISSQSVQISELTWMNDNQKDIILEQEIQIDRFEYCYDINITTYKDVEKVLKCIEQVRK